MSPLTEKEISMLLGILKRLEAGEVMTCRVGPWLVMFDRRGGA